MKKLVKLVKKKTLKRKALKRRWELGIGELGIVYSQFWLKFNKVVKYKLIAIKF